MVLQALVIALLFAEPAAAPAGEAAPAPAAPPTMEQVTAQVDALLAPWKGQSGERLRGRLGLSKATRSASDGEVVFWTRRAEAMGCGIDSSGLMRCGSVSGGECALGVAFEKDGKVKSWRLSGDAASCAIFITDLTPAK